MKYFYDTEFLEGEKTTGFFKSEPTIDLISIGIKSEDGREYYGISKEFDLKEAWNRYDLKHEQVSGDMRNVLPNGITKKVYWIRENVLYPIFISLKKRLAQDNVKAKGYPVSTLNSKDLEFTQNSMRTLLRKYGKTRTELAFDIIDFCMEGLERENPIKFYGYYSAYDHVALCWLFGKMMDLPKGFPMYTIDLKQEIDRIGSKEVKSSKDYPVQSGVLHDALEDAKWNFELYKYLKERWNYQ